MTGDNFWEDNAVLITGHEGFLGSWLSKALIDKGAKVIGFDKVKNRPHTVLKDYRNSMTCVRGDITCLAMVKKVVDRYRPATIFHLAAEAIVGKANKNPVKAFKSNIEGTWNLLEAARDKKYVRRVIIASSDKAYGSCKNLPYKEDTPLRGAHPYDASKSCADLLCGVYHNTYKLPVCVTRCGNIYGPGDYHLSRIVPNAVMSAIRNKVFAIRSDGKFTRDYIYVEDVVNGYIGLAENMARSDIFGQAFNFSNEKPISVLELVKTIYDLAGNKPRYKILNSAKHEIRDQYLCGKKVKLYLGWQPAYSLRKGLIDTIRWYRKFDV